MEIKVIKEKMETGSWCTLCNAPIEDTEIYYLLTLEEREKCVFEEPKYSIPHICKKCFKDGIKFTTHIKPKTNDNKM